MILQGRVGRVAASTTTHYEEKGLKVAGKEGAAAANTFPKLVWLAAQATCVSRLRWLCRPPLQETGRLRTGLLPAQPCPCALSTLRLAFGTISLQWPRSRQRWTLLVGGFRSVRRRTLRSASGGTGPTSNLRSWFGWKPGDRGSGPAQMCWCPGRHGRLQYRRQWLSPTGGWALFGAACPYRVVATP